MGRAISFRVKALAVPVTAVAETILSLGQHSGMLLDDCELSAPHTLALVL